jgi:hypothetical protein
LLFCNALLPLDFFQSLDLGTIIGKLLFFFCALRRLQHVKFAQSFGKLVLPDFLLGETTTGDRTTMLVTTILSALGQLSLQTFNFLPLLGELQILANVIFGKNTLVHEEFPIALLLAGRRGARYGDVCDDSGATVTADNVDFLNVVFTLCETLIDVVATMVSGVLFGVDVVMNIDNHNWIVSSSAASTSRRGRAAWGRSDDGGSQKGIRVGAVATNS